MDRWLAPKWNKRKLGEVQMALIEKREQHSDEIKLRDLSCSRGPRGQQPLLVAEQARKARNRGLEQQK